MAQRTTVVLLDDLTGEEADNVTTVPFGLDGKFFEIDLDEANAAKLRDALAEYVAHARRTGRMNSDQRTPRRAGGGAPATVDRAQSRAMRAWAREQGWEVSERGRIPSAVTEAWHARATS